MAARLAVTWVAAVDRMPVGWNQRVERTNELGHALQPARLGSANCPLAIVTDRFARLDIVLSLPHLSLFATALDEFTEPADRFLNRLAVPDLHINHVFHLLLSMIGM